MAQSSRVWFEVHEGSELSNGTRRHAVYSFPEDVYVVECDTEGQAQLLVDGWNAHALHTFGY